MEFLRSFAKALNMDAPAPLHTENHEYMAPVVKTLPDGMMESPDGASANIGDRLKTMGLLNPDEALIRYEDVRGWFRGGGETYQAIARLETTNETRQVVAKAVASLDRDRGNSMLKRRIDLASAGVITPRLFYTEMSKDGKRAVTFFEEYVPNAVELREHIKSRKRDLLPLGVVEQIGTTAATLDKKGYADIDFLREMIYSKERQCVYFVDFGYDLGDPTGKVTDAALRSLTKHFSGKPEVEEVLRVYHTAMKV